VCALMVAVVSLGATSMPIAGQDDAGSTPASDGGVTQDPVVTPTPVIGSASGGVQPPADDSSPAPQENQQQAAPPSNQQTGPVASATDGDTGVPILAQGLIYLNGDDVYWQVREVQLSGQETVTGNARIVLQRSGASVIRNDVTGKRVRLEPGEAFFAAAGDPYTTFPEGNSGSVVWIFEIANDNNVGEGAFYLSPGVSGYAEGVYDYEFARNVLQAGETAQFEGGTGRSFIMVLSGDLSVTTGDGTASLVGKDGLVIDPGATITGPNSGQAVYVTMSIGPTVADASAAPPAAAETPAASDQQAAPETAVAEEETQAADPAPADSSTGAYVTSIQVGAVEDVGITLYADGELVFDGWLGAGEWTAFYNGSVFEVYTTSGANTLFNNSCGGDSFQMGFEPGEAYYVLEANEDSCAPIG